MAVKNTISADDTYSDSLQMGAEDFNISIWGQFVGTVTLQRSFDSGVSWHDVQHFREETESWAHEPEGGDSYRLGFKAGDYISGSAVVRLGK